jgi:hypothetical protein
MGKETLKIWCVFSVDNNYDQPDNNLVIWFNEKPTLDQLARTLTGKGLDELDEPNIVAIVGIWTGNSDGKLPFGFDTIYRLEEVEEGRKL